MSVQDIVMGPVGIIVVAIIVWYVWSMWRDDHKAKRGMSDAEYQQYLKDTDPYKDNTPHG